MSYATGHIAPRLKQARLAKDLSQRAMSELSGVPQSHISKIENDRLRPSLAMLHKLAEELGVNIASLFSDPAASGPYFLVRADELPAIRLSPTRKEAGIEISRLIAQSAGALLEAHIHVVQPGAGSNGTIVHPGEELGFILEGELEMTIGGETFTARQGDCFYYQARLEHGYRNSSTSSARVLWVCTPPTD
jgi:transcriptional regulator with XRE-family HTH domain